MKTLFDGWTFGNFTLKNVVRFKNHKSGYFSQSRFTDQYLLAVKISGDSMIYYRGFNIDYSANTAVFLPKEQSESFEYYTSSSDKCSGIVILFDCDTPLSTDPQCLKNIDESVKSAAKKLHNYYSLPEKYHFTEIMAAFYELLSLLYRDSRKSLTSDKRAERFSPAIKYIENHIFDKYIDISKLSEACSMTEKYFRNSFKATFGVPPLSYINNMRANKIKLLLINDELTVGEIAAIAGFSDKNYFSRFFKKHFGVSPTKYKNNYFVNL